LYRLIVAYLGLLQVTYRHASLLESSLIDHFLASNLLLDSIHSIEIIDGSNLSDHVLLVMFVSPQHTVDHHHHANPTSEVDFKRLRWDKADLSAYYYSTYEYISLIDAPVSLLTCDGVDEHIAKHCIDSFYNDTVNALCQSTVSMVPVSKAIFSNSGGTKITNFPGYEVRIVSTVYGRLPAGLWMVL